MNILFLIGNGFDINLGLKTAYQDFYKYYLSLDSENGAIEKVKEELRNKTISDWSDLEVALGQYSNMVESTEEYKAVIIDILERLGDYLEQLFDNCDFQTNESFLYQSLFHFGNYFTEGNSKFANQFLENNEQNNIVNIINFNYTDTLERIIEKKLPIRVKKNTVNSKIYYDIINSIVHVHGVLNDSMILGLNDSGQISNINMRNSLVEQCLIKPLMNANTGYGRIESCEGLINNANIIVIFGMSLGETDKIWWNKIVDKLITDNNTILFIINHNKSISRRAKHIYLNEYNSYIDKLLSYYDKKLTDEEKNNLYNRVKVELNTDMFKHALDVTNNYMPFYLQTIK